MSIKFYGLLYLDGEEFSAENVHVKDFQDKISVYLDCAIVISESLKLQGISFTLLTNKKNTLEEIVQRKTEDLQIKEILFVTEVPRKIKFYSAHFKLDVFRYLSSLSDDYVGLCDLDMVCINKLPHGFLNNIKRKTPMYYDISSQVIPAYGYEVIIQSLKSIHGIESEGRWSGGEFISGSPLFFLTLTEEIDRLFDNYVSNIDKLHHVGDEAIVSAALEIIRLRGIYIADAGTLGIVGRFWNIKCLHPQKPFEYFSQCFLLHLPSDKRFFTSLASKDRMHISEFKKCYENHMKLTETTSRLKKIVKRLAINIPTRRVTSKL